MRLFTLPSISNTTNWIVALVSAVLFVATMERARAADDVDAEAKSIIEISDQVRFPREGFQVDVAILSTGPEKEADVRNYRVLSKGNENTIVISTAPATDRGQILLLKARDLWVFLPDISQPVRLSLSQRLTGEVANGDLARANFGGDYSPKVVRTDTIGDTQYVVLELSAIDRGVTYHRVMYWVRKSDSRPFKAEFYSLSDRLLKTCYYENYQKMAGQQRPTRLVMDDALKQNERSVVEYSNMKLRELPDKMFTKEYLKKID